MKKLEDIPKKEIFKVPDDYFDKLPGVIQSRIAADKDRHAIPVFRTVLQYGIPSLAVVVIAVILFFKPEPADSAESILTSIETQDLVAYLDETDISTDELLDEVTLDQLDAEQIEDAVFDLGDQDLEDIADDLDL
ncbi:MAG TPA: hypothetical protein VGK59_07495 [Ohtaekwangia sp.]